MVELVRLHGSCVCVGDAGVLLLGPPGSGKSALVLRLIDEPGYGISGTPKRAEFVADDQVILRLVEGRVIASAPPTIAGSLEIRGLGIVNLPHRAEAVLAIAVRLLAREKIERLPDMAKDRFEILGVLLPQIAVDSVSASAPARIRAALDWLESGGMNIASESR